VVEHHRKVHRGAAAQQSPILGNTPFINAVLHKQEAAARLGQCGKRQIERH